MPVVQVGADGVVAKAAIVGRQIIDVADQNRLAIFRVVDRSGRLAVKSPQGLRGQIGGDSRRNLGLGDLVELLRRELGKGLVGNGAPFAACGVRSDGGRGIQRGNRLFYRQVPEWLNK